MIDQLEEFTVHSSQSIKKAPGAKRRAKQRPK
jgi:hypothetical protein